MISGNREILLSQLKTSKNIYDTSSNNLENIQKQHDDLYLLVKQNKLNKIDEDLKEVMPYIEQLCSLDNGSFAYHLDRKPLDKSDNSWETVYFFKNGDISLDLGSKYQDPIYIKYNGTWESAKVIVNDNKYLSEATKMTERFINEWDSFIFNDLIEKVINRFETKTEMQDLKRNEYIDNMNKYNEELKDMKFFDNKEGESTENEEELENF